MPRPSSAVARRFARRTLIASTRVVVIPGPAAATKIMKLLKTVLFLAIGTRAFGPHGDTTTTWIDEGLCKAETFQPPLNIVTPELCYEECLKRYGDELVAIGHRELLTTIGLKYQCYCADDCLCMSSTDSSSKQVTITRDSAVDALPEPCPPGGGRKLKSRKAQK